MQRKAFKQVSYILACRSSHPVQQGHTVDQREGISIKPTSALTAQVFSSTEKTKFSEEFEEFEAELEPLCIGVER